MSYKLIVRDLGTLSQDTLKEIFKRINSTNYGLNTIEINNALYDGKFMQCAKSFIEKTDFQNLPFLSESSISRMEDIDYTLLIMATILEGGYFSLSKEVEKYIKNYNDSFEEYDYILDKMINIYSLIKSFGFNNDSIWYRKSNFYTLFCEMAFLYKSEDENYFTTNKKEIARRLLELENSILAAKNNEDSKYNNYYSAMYSGTNNRTSRVVRGNSVREALKK